MFFQSDRFSRISALKKYIQMKKLKCTDLAAASGNFMTPPVLSSGLQPRRESSCCNHKLVLMLNKKAQI